MADNVDITAGAGTTIATDDCTTGQVQLVKLAYGADGDRTHVPADAGGLLVNLGANNDVTVTGDVSVTGTFWQATQPVSGTFWQATQPVSGTVTANLSGTDNGVLDAIAASLAGTLVVDGSGATQPVSGTFWQATQPVSGTFWQATQPVSGTFWQATQPVSGTVTIQDGGNTITVDGTVTVNLAAGTATNEVVGDVAHGVAAAGNPVQIGLEGRSTVGTAVDDGDVVRALASTHGKQVVLPFAIPAATKSYASPAAVTDTADDEAFAAIASTRTYITSAQIFNADATVGTEVVIKDGSSVLFRGYAAAAGGGVSAQFNPPLRGTANTAVNVANITTSAETYFNLQGYSATE